LGFGNIGTIERRLKSEGLSFPARNNRAVLSWPVLVRWWAFKDLQRALTSCGGGW
jgi:hypothetical protein